MLGVPNASSECIMSYYKSFFLKKGKRTGKTSQRETSKASLGMNSSSFALRIGKGNGREVNWKRNVIILLWVKDLAYSNFRKVTS